MIRSFFTHLLSLPIYLYRYGLSPVLGMGKCRFTPACSVYALEALRIHGPLRGLWLTFRRVGRCHPYCTADPFDPVPHARHCAEQSDKAI